MKFALLIALLFAAACDSHPGASAVDAAVPTDGGAPDAGPPARSYWLNDMLCAPPACTPIIVDTPLPHMGDTRIAVLGYAGPDDAVMIWARCTRQVGNCFQASHDFGACLAAASKCDPSCVAQVQSAIAGGADPIQAFDDVYLAEGAPCRPVE